MTVRQEKNLAEIKVHLNEKLKVDLKDLAAQEGHEKLSSFIRQILRKHVYGSLTPNRDMLAGTVSDS